MIPVKIGADGRTNAPPAPSHFSQYRPRLLSRPASAVNPGRLIGSSPVFGPRLPLATSLPNPYGALLSFSTRGGAVLKVGMN